jgi:hypothetical protein
MRGKITVTIAMGGTSFARRRPAFAQVLTIILLSIPGVTWISSVGDITAYWQYEVPAGQILYLLSKLAGLYAFVVFWMQLMYGLLGAHARERLRVELGNEFHRKLGAIVCVLIVAHVALFISGVTVRTHHFASQYLTVSFSSGYYRSIISLGIIAALLVVVGVAAALVRHVFHRGWKFGHWALLLAFGLAFFHSISIGSESRTSPVSALYALMGALVPMALVLRVTCQPTREIAICEAEARGASRDTRRHARDLRSGTRDR